MRRRPGGQRRARARPRAPPTWWPAASSNSDHEQAGELGGAGDLVTPSTSRAATRSTPRVARSVASKISDSPSKSVQRPSGLLSSGERDLRAAGWSEVRASLLAMLAEAIEVSSAACDRLATQIREHAVPIDREESRLPDLDRNDIGNFYLALVAICHQTSPQNRPALEGVVGGRHLRGWDYLSARFEQAVSSDPQLLFPERWRTVSAYDVAELFRDTQFGERLTDPGGRAKLIQNLGDVMKQHGCHRIDELYRASDCRLASGHSPLIPALSKFRAYDDPVRKKTYFFLALMQNSSVWEYADPQNLGPPVDYHEVRGHLRIGTVIIRDPSLRSKLLARESVSADEDVAIRSAVSQVLLYLSQATGLKNASRLHYLLWNIFRSCCTRDEPHCFACPSTCSLPPRYVAALHSKSVARACPYAAICTSSGRSTKLTEHVFETDYY